MYVIECVISGIMLVQVLGNQAPNLTMSGYPLHQLEALDTRNQNLNNLAITWHYLADQHKKKKKKKRPPHRAETEPYNKAAHNTIRAR